MPNRTPVRFCGTLCTSDIFNQLAPPQAGPLEGRAAGQRGGETNLTQTSVPPDALVPELPLIRALSPTLAVLTAMITPAVLMSGCAMMILSTSTRLGRVVDRVRELSDRFQELLTHAQPTDLDREQQRMIISQLGQFSTRARILQRSLTTFYLALSVFIATSMTIGVVAIGWIDWIWLPMGLSLVGMCCMLVGSALLIVEARQALLSVYDETEFLWQLATRSAPTGIVIPERATFASFVRRFR